MSWRYDFRSHLTIIISWRHHNGLGTQKSLHIMTSSYVWQIDCISVNIDRFSSKLWYVVAETILYKISALFFILMTSSWWKFQLKATCHNFLHLRVISMGRWLFRSHHESTWHSSLSTMSRLFVLNILSQILVCCSWDHMLSKIFRSDVTCFVSFNQVLGSCQFSLKVV